LIEAQANGANGSYDYGTVAINWYGYLLIVYLLALIAAAPIQWKRKLSSVAAGLIVVYLYFLLSFYILLLYKFDQFVQIHALHLEGFSKGIVNLLYPLLSENPGTPVFVALFIYVLVVFRRADWD